MRQNRSKEILYLFTSSPESCFTVEELSAKFGVSVRQIRNYIRQINEESEILLSENGSYRIDRNYLKKEEKKDNNDFSPEERVNIIISRLLLEEDSVDLYELADELFVSDASIEADLKKVRRRIEPFGLHLKNSEGLLRIEGSEKNKRSLTSYMITNTHFKGFMSNDSGRFLNDDYQIDVIRKNLEAILNESYFFYNDYSLNNIILHLIITIDRLRNDFQIKEAQMILDISDIERQTAEKIADFIEEGYDVRVSESEKNNIAAFLSCNLATLDYRMINPDNIEKYISHETIQLVRYILEKISDYYLLDSFDDIFFARFCLHVENLMKRQRSRYSVHNPMQTEIKMSYPLIFDIAVYAASLIKEKTGFQINQDEISLIALHIGSFIESADSNRNKVSAIYVYADYHQFYQHNISILQNRFEKELNLLYTVSVNDFRNITAQPDLIISEVKIPEAIIVSPFISEEQLDTIREAIRKRTKQKENDHFIDAFAEMFTEDLFFTDIYGKDEFDVIEKLTDRIRPKNYFDQSYVESVMNRERMSSTCFIKKLAIPHAIGQNISQSFISMVCYDKKQNWGNEDISLLILFGISYPDRKNFRFVFNHIVEIFNKEANINAISRCRSYEQVIDIIVQIVNR